MMRQNGIATLRAQITSEVNQLREIVRRVANKRQETREGQIDDFVVVGFAGYLHSFCNGLENIFKLIAEYLDDFEPQGPSWHRVLLKQMTLEIQGLRPPLLSAELAKTLHDYLEFRHLFRHSYSFDLEWEELRDKVDRLPDTFAQFELAVQNFIAFLKHLNDATE